MPVRPLAVALLAIPAVALTLLTWFATAVSHHTTAACADWAVQFRHARDDLAAVERLWDTARPGGLRPPERTDFRNRVETLRAARPARCDVNGHRTG